MRFDHCYVTNSSRFIERSPADSVCTPSRATIITGQHNHTNGVQTLISSIDNRLPNVAKQLRGYGDYQTAIFGKWHLGEGKPHEPRGFDHWDIIPGQGQYFDPTFINESGTYIEKGYVTDIITDKTIQFIEKRDESKPFFVMCHHKAPHRSWECDAKHRDLYKDEIKMPDTYNDDYKNRAKAAAAAKMRVEMDITYYDLGLAQPDGGEEEVGPLFFPEMPHLTDRKIPMPDDVRKMRPLICKHTGERFTFTTRDELSKWKYQRYMQRYLQTIQSIDDNVGRLLDYLESSGLAENTLVMYTSDQGFFLGEHGWFDKRFIYEESFQMPVSPTRCFDTDRSSWCKVPVSRPAQSQKTSSPMSTLLLPGWNLPVSPSRHLCRVTASGAACRGSSTNLRMPWRIIDTGCTRMPSITPM